MEKKKPPTLEQIENDLFIANNALDTALKPLGQVPEWKRQQDIEDAVKNMIRDLQGALYDLELRRPMVVVTEELPTEDPPPCDECPVTLNNLDAETYCYKCPREGELMTFVPKELEES